MRIYCDSAPVIYYVERVPVYRDRVARPFEDDDVDLVASDMTRLECRLKPMRLNEGNLLAQYDGFFEELEIVTLSTSVVDGATSLRAERGYATPDAIHLAAALASGCDIFLTNDRSLSDFTDIPIELID